MANSWDGVNLRFQIDTSTNVAGLEALKGGVPAITDAVGVYNNATLTIEKDVSLLVVYLHATATNSDPGAGQRRGNWNRTGGNITWGGTNADYTSGLIANPPAVDTTGNTTKGGTITVNPASAAYDTNSSGALDSTHRYCYYLKYYTLVAWNNITLRYTSYLGNAFLFLYATSTYTTSASVVFGTWGAVLGQLSGSVYVLALLSQGIPIDLGNLTLDLGQF